MNEISQARSLFPTFKEVYEEGQLIIKKYGNKVKMTYFKKPIRAKGFELRDKTSKISKSIEDEKHIIDSDGFVWIVSDNARECEHVFGEQQTKNQANIRRAKAAIYELAMCNDWQYFCTFTISPEKYKRNDLKEFYKAFAKFINNYSFRNETKVRYLLIPELHKDKKNWHMHGLMSGIIETDLQKFKKGEVPERLIKNKYLNFEKYQQKFGFCSFDKVREHEAVSAYITKYITKEMEKCVSELGAHMYYCSKGLNRSEEITRQYVEISNFKGFDYDNEYVAVKWCNLEELKEKGEEIMRCQELNE